MNCYILIMKHGKCRIRDNIIFLPAAITLRRVDTEYVRTGFHKCRNSFFVVECVDAGTDDIAFLIVEQFAGIVLVFGIVLAENHV